MERFSVIGLGKILPNASAQNVVKNLSQLLKRPAESLTPLLNKKIVLKRNLDSVETQKFIGALQNTGLAVRSELQTEPALFTQSLVASENYQPPQPAPTAKIKKETELEADVLRYELPIKTLAPKLSCWPINESLKSPQSINYQIENHRLWFSPLIIILATLIAAPIMQQFLLLAGSDVLDGLSYTIASIIFILFFLIYLPTLLPIHRLISLRSVKDKKPIILMKENYSGNPLQKKYTITTENDIYFAEAPRYSSGKITLFNLQGEPIFYITKYIKPDHFLDKFSFKKSKRYAIYNAREQTLGRIYRHKAGAIHIKSKLCTPEQRPLIILLSTMGLGVN